MNFSTWLLHCDVFPSLPKVFHTSDFSHLPLILCVIDSSFDVFLHLLLNELHTSDFSHLLITQLVYLIFLLLIRQYDAYRTLDYFLQIIVPHNHLQEYYTNRHYLRHCNMKSNIFLVQLIHLCCNTILLYL